MSLDTFLLLHVYLSIAPSTSLRLLELQVPSMVDIREKATLICKFDLEGDHFFSLKWYKEELEFFRYMPDYVPLIRTFGVDGINLLERESNISVITLSPLEYTTSGLYRCEVSAGAPHFKVVYQHANMTVLGLPTENPKIYGIQKSYTIGSYVAVNCTSSPSHPPATMNWYINGIKAQQWFIDHYYLDQPGNKLNLETRTIGLKFQTGDIHFQQRKDGSLSLVCTATVADRTRRTEMRVYLTKLSREEFAHQFSRCCGNINPSLCVLITIIILLRTIKNKFFICEYF